MKLDRLFSLKFHSRSAEVGKLAKLERTGMGAEAGGGGGRADVIVADEDTGGEVRGDELTRGEGGEGSEADGALGAAIEVLR